MTDTYGTRFKACRRALGLTQLELATKIGLTRSSIANIEADRQRSLVDDVARYAHQFGVDPAWLAYGRVTVEGQPLPKPRTVASSDLVTLSNNLQKLAVQAMKLSAIADSDSVQEIPLASHTTPRPPDTRQPGDTATAGIEEPGNPMDDSGRDETHGLGRSEP